MTALLLVGGGKMGAALLAGWIAKGTKPADVLVVEPLQETGAALARRHGVRVVAGAGEVPADVAPATVVFAVKPQMMDEVVPHYRRFAGDGTCFLSIAAGTPIAYFKHRLGDEAVVVRAMPNTPAAVGRGVSVLCADNRADGAQRATCESLMAAVGGVRWIEDEEMMHAVTAVSGGGPAYVFLLVECLAHAGAEAGLPETLAADIARATVAGAGALLDASDEPASRLRENVTSPGGTTKAALDVLMGDHGGIQPIFLQAIAAAAGRSRELAG